MYRLIGVSGPGDGKECTIDSEPVILGRLPNCTLPLTDSQVSREHCELWKAEGRLHLRDLRTINGTYVNGQRILERVLHRGDTLRIGESTFVVESENEQGDVDESPEGGEADPFVAWFQRVQKTKRRIELRTFDKGPRFNVTFFEPMSKLGGPGIWYDRQLLEYAIEVCPGAHGSFHGYEHIPCVADFGDMRCEIALEVTQPNVLALRVTGFKWTDEARVIADGFSVSDNLLEDARRKMYALYLERGGTPFF